MEAVAVIDRIVLVSDCTDVAFAEMRGGILSAAHAVNPSARLDIEPLVPCADYSVVNAGFVIRLVAEAYPPGTLIMFVMNSLQQRTERIIGRTATGGLYFEGTNTGAAGWLLDDFGVAECYELHDPGFVPFGGKYVHSPAVGRFVAGVPMAELGRPFPVGRIRRVRAREFEVVHVDNFGNAKIAADLRGVAVGDQVRVGVAGEEIEAVYHERMMACSDGTWVVYPGSSFGLLEIGEVRGPGMRRFGTRAGDIVSVKSGSGGAA
jgi:S-adenosylmethionine hydrolase